MVDKIHFYSSMIHFYNLASRKKRLNHLYFLHILLLFCIVVFKILFIVSTVFFARFFGLQASFSLEKNEVQFSFIIKIKGSPWKSLRQLVKMFSVSRNWNHVAIQDMLAIVSSFTGTNLGAHDLLVIKEPVSCKDTIYSTEKIFSLSLEQKDF